MALTKISRGLLDTGVSDSSDATAITIDSSENVGIGTTSPTTNAGFGTPLLEVRGSSGGSLLSTNSTTSGEGVFTTRDTGINISMSGAATASTGNNIVFRTGNTNSDYNSTERMRIDSSGRFLVNTTSASTLVTIQGDTTADVMTVRTGSNANNNVGAIVFRDGAQEYCGQIVVNGQNNTTGYTTSSDYRLKENVDYTWDATTRLKQLRPARFNWISDPTDTLIDGFLAHEVSDIVPEAITGEKDATETYTDEDGNEQTTPIYQGIDQAKLVPLLVKTIQELEARITTLENE